MRFLELRLLIIFKLLKSTNLTHLGLTLHIETKASAVGHQCHGVFLFFQILLFLKGFTEDQRNKLAIVTGIILANGEV